jgi:hypothetical protein
MTHIVIHLERGPENQPVGQLTTDTGRVTNFTGWLHLIRLLEDELRDAPERPDPDGPGYDPSPNPSSGD